MEVDPSHLFFQQGGGVEGYRVDRRNHLRPRASGDCTCRRRFGLRPWCYSDARSGKGYLRRCPFTRNEVEQSTFTTFRNTPMCDKQLELFDFYESEANRLMAAELHAGQPMKM